MNFKTDNCPKIFNKYGNSINSVAILNGHQAISPSHDGTIKLFDLKSGNIIQTFKGHSDFVGVVKPINEHQFVSGSHDGTIKFWDLNWLNKLSLIEELFFETLYLYVEQNKKKLCLTMYPHAHKIFYELPKNKQKYAIENDLVSLKQKSACL